MPSRRFPARDTQHPTSICYCSSLFDGMSLIGILKKIQMIANYLKDFEMKDLRKIRYFLRL